ncbi:MAG: hypothetical protein Q8891_09990 [Bacteroidota bacterium]|nr:hypothetical protein [Bacteroidota bacterium]
MGNNFETYIQKLELIGFFAGYAIVYALVHFIKGEQRKKTSSFINCLPKLLPYAYALTGTLFLGMVLKNISIDLSLQNIVEQFQNPYLKIWGLLSVLFWIPALSKKPVYSLFHSLVFFFLLIKDFWMLITSSIDSEIIKNDMKVYTDSLLLNTANLACIAILWFVMSKIRESRKTSSD